MSQAPVTTLRNVQLSLGGAPLFSGVDLSLTKGVRASLVGRNGAGKSTLMRILARELDPDDGDVWRQPGAALHYLKQEPDFSAFSTALDIVAADVPAGELHRAEAELEMTGLSADADPAALSGGQRRRLALARAFAADPDILLLDEPTNHLDIDAIEALETRLKSFRGAMLVVSHDRRFLEAVTTSIAWLRQGVVRAFDRGYAHFEPLAEQVEAEEEKALERLETKLKAEQRWLARGVTARRKRNMGRLRKLQTMRTQQASRKSALNSARETASLVSETGDAASKLVIETKGLSKTFATPEGPLSIVQELDLKIMRGDRVGVMGGNGAGKTTLLRLLLKRMDADTGRVRLAKNLEIAYLDQTRDRLKPADTLWESLAPIGGDHIMVRGASRHVASYAKDFMFSAAQLRQPVGALSGGERNRLTLALALAQPSNLLVLDEPTNDLDIETLDMLEEMLSDYDGTLIIVSHDRAFIDGVVTSLLTPEGGGQWLETPGGYADYLAQTAPKPTPANRNKRAAQDTARPTKAPTKLSYKDARRGDALERLIPEREAEIKALENALAEPELFTSNPDVFSAKAARLDAAKLELDAYENEWLDLEDKRDRLSGTS